MNDHMSTHLRQQYVKTPTSNGEPLISRAIAMLDFGTQVKDANVNRHAERPCRKKEHFV